MQSKTQQVTVSLARRNILSLFCALLCLITLGITSPNTMAIVSTQGDVYPDYNGQDPWNFNKNIIIGDTGIGSLLVENGSDVESGGSGDGYEIIGNESTAVGSAIVYGTGSTWYSHKLSIGYGGTGTLLVKNGGLLDSFYGSIGTNAGSSGEVTINGSGATWDVVLGIDIGRAGDGTLIIKNDGLVQGIGVVWVGREDTGTGVINFDTGTLTMGGLAASPSELLGTGTINVEGLVTDFDVVFDATHSYQQQFVLNSLPDQNVTINLDASNAASEGILGAGYRGTSSLTIADGMSVSSLGGGYIGYHTGAIGTATVSGAGSVWNNGDITVGKYGSGTLTIDDGGQVESEFMYVGKYGAGTVNIQNGGALNCDRSYIGTESGSTGTVSVIGSGSTWNAGTLYLGGDGDGTLNIESGAVVNVGSGYISNGIVGGSATVSVSGSASALNVTGEYYLGYWGTGSFNIEDGAAFTSNTMYIGYKEGSSGTVTISGSDSTWNSGDIYVGYEGSGTLNIENGAVISADINLAAGHKSNGSLTISGPGSALYTTDNLGAGYYLAAAEINIENGGLLDGSGKVCMLGEYESSNVTATVTGAGSTLKCGTLFLGNEGDATLNISDGGYVEVDGGYTWLGRYANASGVINFDNCTLNTTGLVASTSDLRGTGTINTTKLLSDIDLVFDATHGLHKQFVLNSLPGQNITLNLDFASYQNMGMLGAGYRGTSSLTIADGVSITSSRGYIGYGVGSSGTVTVTGPGSTWDMGDGELLMSSEGTSSLLVENGGIVNADPITLYGTATITGSGSQLNSGDDLYVYGTLNVSDGGMISSRSDYIYGDVTVSGPNTAWDSSRILRIGYGNSSFRIEDGAVVSSSQTIIGFEGNAVATVTGNGSVWNLHNGRIDSILIIENGGVVNSQHTVTLGLRHCTATVTVTGPGSTWNISNYMRMGIEGDSILNIEDGGEVHYLYARDFELAQYSSSDAQINLSGGLLDMCGGQLFVGSGTATFNFTGGTLLNAASIDLGQPLVQQGGTLAPGGSIGTTNIIGDYQLTAGTVEIELGGVGSPHDMLSVTGNIDITQLDTTLSLSIIGSVLPGTYTIIESTAGTLTGQFENIIGLDSYPGTFDVQYTTTSVILSLNALLGDLNADGFIGLDDLDIVLLNWNQTVTPWDLASGDTTGDGYVGLDDLDLILSHWNQGTPPSNISTNIPEPSTLSLLFAVMISASTKRRRVL